MTALETFCKELERQITIETFQFYKDWKEKCLATERQQIIDAYMGGIDGWLTSTKEEYKNGAEQYYNETYKKD